MRSPISSKVADSLDSVFNFSCWFPPLVEQECKSLLTKAKEILSKQPILRQIGTDRLVKFTAEQCCQKLRKIISIIKKLKPIRLYLMKFSEPLKGIFWKVLSVN